MSAADGALLAFAGLWERWREPEGQENTSCTIIVRDAAECTAKYHDRMPCMLHPKDFDAWLSGEGGKELLLAPPIVLQKWIVSKRVKKAGEGEENRAIIEPVVF